MLDADSINHSFFFCRSIDGFFGYFPCVVSADFKIFPVGPLGSSGTM
jgi:hypothetical protein